MSLAGSPVVTFGTSGGNSGPSIGSSLMLGVQDGQVMYAVFARPNFLLALAASTN